MTEIKLKSWELNGRSVYFSVRSVVIYVIDFKGKMSLSVFWRVSRKLLKNIEKILERVSLSLTERVGALSSAPLPKVN